MKRAIFIGQAMPRFKKHPHAWPSLNSWLYSLRLTDNEIKENFFYSALVDYFPGPKGSGHRVPSQKEIRKERERLKNTINNFNPEIVIPIGKLSIAYCLETNVPSLKNYIGRTFKANPYGVMDKEILIIPLPHPSGASTWHKKLENKRLLTKALDLLKFNL